MKKMLLVLVALIGFVISVNAQVATAEKYGIKVEMFFDSNWESTNRYTGNSFPKISFEFVVSGENRNFKKVVVKIILLDNEYGFAMGGLTDVNRARSIDDLNKSSDWNMVEITNQGLGNYIFSKQYWEMYATRTTMSEERLKKCVKIEIREVY